MHFPDGQMSKLWTTVQEMNKISCTFQSPPPPTSQTKQRIRIWFEFLFVTLRAPAPVTVLHVYLKSCFFTFALRKEKCHTWHLRLFAIIASLSRVDITGSTNLSTVSCYEEVTKVHSNRGFNCVRTWWFTTACPTCDCLFAPSWEEMLSRWWGLKLKDNSALFHGSHCNCFRNNEITLLKSMNIFTKPDWGRNDCKQINGLTTSYTQFNNVSHVQFSRQKLNLRLPPTVCTVVQTGALQRER